MTKPISQSAPFLPNRRQVLIAGAAVGAGLILPRSARAASIPLSYACDRASGFVMDPNVHKRVGYLTNFGGMGLSGLLTKDLRVNCPLKSAAYAGASFTAPTGSSPVSMLNVVGVMEQMTWAGGVGDSLRFDFYVSQQNAVQLKSLQQTTLKNTTISSLGFWIVDYDQEVKTWFEQAYPKSAPTLAGILQKTNPTFDVDLNPVVVKNGIDVNVYKVSLEMFPAANQAYTVYSANSSKTSAIKPWGLVVGSMAKAATP